MPSNDIFNRQKKYEIPSDPVIQGILNSIGKYTKDKELNCGACGYPTCREKAVAVYNIKAQLHMCLPFMRERAESISNLIINTTPNAIFAC
jgi:Na+-translocating ferredoxin:NAD+ oxidoreductase RNF subunit RnfB